MKSTTFVIYRKELSATLRDRKTLIFMLLLPTLLMPLLMFGLGRMMQSIQRAEEVRVVRIAADADSRDAYRDLVFTWFAESSLGSQMRLLDTPVVRALLKPASENDGVQLPQNVTRDPAAFEDWVRSLAPMVRANLDSVEARPAKLMEKLDKDIRDELITFYRMAIKGLALVEFVDPKELEAEQEGWIPGHVPEDAESLGNFRQIAWNVNRRAVQGLLVISGEVNAATDSDTVKLPVMFVHDSTIPLSAEAWSRLRFVLNRGEDAIVLRRLGKRGLGREFLEPLDFAETQDLASPERRALNLAGTFLPYMVIIFAFLGGLYPALDLGAGEKEHNTLEPLLVTPASRTEIALGKFLVILTTSLTASLLGMVSLAVSYRLILPEAVLDLMQLRIDPLRLLPVLALAVPASASFAGIFLAISIHARSFKEAQTYIAPLQFLLILPAVAPIVPGVEMSWRLAFVPLVNISLLARDLLKGDANWGHYGVSLGVCILLAAACIGLCVWQFRREEVLFRT